MIREEMTIINKSGLHVRPASVLADAAGKFESEIAILFDGQRFNAKSVIKILAACIKVGDTVEVEASGPDEKAAMDHVRQLIKGGLGEI